MGRFAALLKPFVIIKIGDSEKDKEAFAAPGRNQREAAAALPSLVQEVGLYWWASNNEIPKNGPYLVVGVFSWSNYDLRLLDALAETSQTLHEKNIRIEIFDMDDAWVKAGDLNKRIPGIEEIPIYHSPIVGIWRNGELTEKGEGYVGRELVYQFLHTITGRDLRPR